MSLQDDDREVSMDEATALLRVTRPTLQKWVNEKKILSTMKGGRRYIKLTEIMRFRRDGNHPDSEQEKQR